jgi:hypothetical protein
MLDWESTSTAHPGESASTVVRNELAIRAHKKMTDRTHRNTKDDIRRRSFGALITVFLATTTRPCRSAADSQHVPCRTLSIGVLRQEARFSTGSEPHRSRESSGGLPKSLDRLLHRCRSRSTMTMTDDTSNLFANLSQAGSLRHEVRFSDGIRKRIMT